MKEIRDTKATELYLRLLGDSHRQISSYVFSLVSNFEDAHDILQETIGVMWKKFDEFEPGTDFVAWGIKIARFNILAYRKKKSNQKVFFSDALFDQIEQVAQDRCEDSDDRLKSLRSCLHKLPQDDLLLLKNRYELNHSVKVLAAQMGRSIQHVYKHLARIQYLLYRCIKQGLARYEG